MRAFRSCFFSSPSSSSSWYSKYVSHRHPLGNAFRCVSSCRTPGVGVSPNKGLGVKGLNIRRVAAWRGAISVVGAQGLHDAGTLTLATEYSNQEGQTSPTRTSKRISGAGPGNSTPIRCGCCFFWWGGSGRLLPDESMCTHASCSCVSACGNECFWFWGEVQ